MAEDLVTLGFAFSSDGAETEINKLISALGNLDTKADEAKTSLGKLFGDSFVSGIDKARKSLGRFNAGLVQTASFARDTLNAIRPLPAQIGNMAANQENLKPIPSAVLNSLAEYGRLVREAAEAVAKLNVEIRAIPAAPAVELSKAMKQTGRHAEDLGEAITQMFRTGTLAAFFKKSTEMAVAFGVELAHINSLTLEFDPEKIRSGLLDISSVYGSATKNAEALYYAYSSGVRGSEGDLVNFTESMAGLSALIRSNVIQTVDAATSAMNAYNLSAADASQLTDLFYGIVKQGKAHGEQLAAGLGQVISTAATAGLSLDEMGASIASLTKVMKTRNAITYFNNMLSKLIKPTKECRLAAEKLGIELGLDALRAKGFSGMMQEIHDKTQGAQQAILNLFPDLRGQRAALQLLNKGWGDFQNQLQFFSDKSGIAKSAMEELTNDVYYQLNAVPATINKIKIATGDLLVSALTLGGALTPLLKAFNNMGSTGQKVFGALTLIAGGYLLVATSQKIRMALTILEMKYNAILSGQRVEETGEHVANTAAINAETAAIQANSAAKMANAGAGGVSRGIGAIARSGIGFAGGFKETFDTTKFVADLNTSGEAVKGLLTGLAHPLRSFSAALRSMKSGQVVSSLATSFSGLGKSMKIFFGGLGAFLGKVATVATKIFTAANAIIVGTVAVIVGAVDMIQSLIRTGSAYEGSGVLVPVAKFLHDWWYDLEDVEKSAKELDKGLSEQLKLHQAKKEVENFASGIMESFADGFREVELPEKSIQEQMSAAYDSMTKYVQERVDKFSPEKLIAAQNDAAKTYNEYSAQLKYVNALHRENIKVSEEDTKKLEELKNAWEASHDELKKIEANAEQNKASVIQYYKKIQDLAKAQKESIEAIRGMSDEIRYSWMTDEQKMRVQTEKMSTARKEFYRAITNGETKVAETAFKNMTSAYNTIVKDAESRMQRYDKMTESLKGDMFDYLLEAADGVPEKIGMLRKKADRLYQEIGGQWGDFYGNRLYLLPENADLTASYQKAKQAANMQIRAMQMEIQEKQRLAQAEKRANDNTLQLIKSMDKFKNTTVEAVDANSIEALRLQSRSFFTPVKFEPMTTAQAGMGNSQEQLRELYNELAVMVKSFGVEAGARSKAAEFDRDKAKKEMEEVLAKNDTILKQLDDNAVKLQEGMKELADAITQGGQGIKNPLEKVQKAVSNLSVVVY